MAVLQKRNKMQSAKRTRRNERKKTKTPRHDI